MSAAEPDFLLDQGLEQPIGAGLSLRRIPGSVMEISAFRSEAEVLKAALDLPPPGRFVDRQGETLIAYRPHCWLLLSASSDPSSGASRHLLPQGEKGNARQPSPSPPAGEGGRRPDEGSLQLNRFAEKAALIDQSHGKLVLALEGDQAPALMMRGCRLDLREGHFPAGATGTTLIGQMTVTLLCDAPGQRYRLIIGSTFADAVAGWIRRAAAHLPA